MKALLPLMLLSVTAAALADPASCPQAAEQLTEYLASAKQRIGADGEVRVAFDVNADGRPQLVSLTGSRAYQSPVRIALDSLDCRRGTPQRYVLNIRFADPAPRAMAVAASATLAQSPPADSAERR